MRITHNNLNDVIAKMDIIIDKGQPWAKKNKERAIRSWIREMKREQKKPITLWEVLFYFWMWIKKPLLRKPQDLHHRGDPCIYCGTPHDEVEPGPCPGRINLLSHRHWFNNLTPY